jgi:PKD repeat protein
MKTLLFLLTLLITKSAVTQTANCGTDQMLDYLRNHSSLYLEKENQNNQRLYHFLTSDSANYREKTIYTIPIVFHIMHQGGVENIPDATVIEAVNELNERFQNTGQYYDPNGHPVDIQFCLASIDPWGNPTNGITHDFSSMLSIDYYDYIQDWTLKTQNRWNPYLYLNVWTVGSIVDLSNTTGVAAYATFPNNSLIEVDGIVAHYNGLVNSSLLAHEVGHYFSLYHTFNNGCTNFNCLLDGDKVCDTPPDNSNNYAICQGNSCATELNDTSGYNPFQGDVVDLPNYMDYTQCPLSFTDGQVTRMQTALINLRPTLLQSNGCGLHPGSTFPSASFTIDSSFCKGTGKYGFHSTSSNSLYTAWDFDGNGTIDTVGETVTHHFSSSGLYHVKLYANGYNGMDTLAQTINVFVANNPYYPISGGTSGTTIDPIMHIPYACIGTQVTVNGAPGMSSYLWSNGATSQNATFTIDTTTELSLTVTTPSGELFSSCQTFKIGVNPRIHLAIDIGADTVDCGDLVVLRWYPIPYWFPATNTWYRNGNLFSTNQTVLGNYGIPAGDQYVWVANNVDPIGCMTNSDTIHFFVNDPIPISLSFDGTTLRTSYDCLANNWFRDGVQINGASDSALVVTQNGCYWGHCINCSYLTTDTICITNLSFDELNIETEIQLYPNPFSETLTIHFSETQNDSWIELLETTGKLVRKVSVHGEELLLNRNGLASGTYFIHIYNENTHLNATRFLLIE